VNSPSKCGSKTRLLIRAMVLIGLATLILLLPIAQVKCPNCHGTGSTLTDTNGWWNNLFLENGDGVPQGFPGPSASCIRCGGTGRLPGDRKYPVWNGTHSSGSVTYYCLDYVERVDDDMVLHCRGLGRIDMFERLEKPRVGTVQYVDMLTRIRECCQGREIEVGVVGYVTDREPYRNSRGDRIGESVTITEKDHHRPPNSIPFIEPRG